MLKQARVAILISGKADFKLKLVKQAKKDIAYWQRKNSSRSYNNCKYICTRHWCTKFHKTNTVGQKGQMGHNTIIVDYFNTPLPPTGKSSRQKNQ
jgi:hypothetical protein